MILGVLLGQDTMSMRKADVADGGVVVLDVMVVEEAEGVRWIKNS